MTPGVERVMRAVARTHLATGCPITVHTHPGTERGLDVHRVMAEEGVDPRAVVLGHSGDSTDAEHLSALAEAGYWLGMDRFGINLETTFEDRADVVVELCRRGLAEAHGAVPRCRLLHRLDRPRGPADAAAVALPAHRTGRAALPAGPRGDRGADHAMLVDNPRRTSWPERRSRCRSRDGCARPDGQPPRRASAAWRAHSSGITAAGQVVGHALDDPQLGARHGFGGGPPTRQRDQRIGRTVDHQGRDPHPGQPVGPVRRGEDGHELADGAVGVVAPVVVAGRPVPRTSASSKGKPGEARIRDTSMDWSMTASRPSAGSTRRAAMASGVGGPVAGPGVDMIDVRLRVRVGWSMANCWAIIPPIDAPSTWADPMPGRRAGRRRRPPCRPAGRGPRVAGSSSSAPTSGTPASSNQVDSPWSRLSKVMTK